MNKKWLFGLGVLVFLMMLFPESTEAQCAMCKAAPGSNLQAGGTDAKGLNRGILMLFMAPYTLVGIIAFIWWRNKKRAGDEAPSNAELQRELDAALSE